MRNRSRLLLVRNFLPVAGLLCGGFALADEGAAQDNVLRMVMEHSGWPGFIIIMMSIVAFFLALRFAFLLRNSVMMPESLVTALGESIDSGSVGTAMKKCLDDNSYLARVMEDGLQELRAGHQEMITAAEDSAEAESIRLHQQINWLSIIGAIAPMLGLMGTVLGMIGAFAVIAAEEGQPPPALLASHIQHALITTALGLIVGVPVLVVYAALRNRATAKFLDMGLIVSDLLDRFKHTDITPAMVEDIEDVLDSALEEAETESKPETPDDAGENVPPPPPQA